MEMSLDDYIRRAENNENFDNLLTVKTENHGRYDEDELMLHAEIEDDTEEIKTWRWPSTHHEFANFDSQQNKKENISTRKISVEVHQQNEGYDLRDKITGLISSEMPDANSQNWRMMRPNIFGSRPAGMPPLVPKCAKQRKQKNKNSNYFKRNRNCGKFNNAGIIFAQNANRSHELFNKNLNAQQNENTVFNVTLPFNGLTTNKPKLNAGLNPIQNRLNTNNQISQLGLYGLQSPQEVNKDMLPQIAAKMLDLIQNSAVTTTHKPMYDLSIHKEICQIQQKPFLYKCGTAGVVSTDGPGIDHLKILPAATTKSMNCRFG